MILYLNTQDQKVVSVALKKDKKMVVQLTEENQYGSQLLLPLIVKLLKNNRVEFKDLTGIEVKEGPGSFTGLRVGASIAQALGFVLNIPVNGYLNKPVRLRYT